MDTFSLHAGSVNFIVLILLIGIVLAMLIFNSYTLISNRDKLLRMYNFYLLSSLLFAGWNIFKLVQAGSFSAFYASTNVDGLSTGLLGLVCILFYGYVFSLFAAQKFFRIAWYICIVARCLQLIILLMAISMGRYEDFDFLLWQVLNGIVIISSLLIVLYAIILRRKTGFQKIILSGAIVFNAIALFSVFSQNSAHLNFFPGINMIVIAFIFEHLFYAVASSRRIKEIYTEAQQLKLKNVQHQLQVESINKEMVSWQLAALHSQMNPHFIFNALNSIQQFTLTGEIDKANSYISKFSKMLRKVLHTSREPFISVEQETEQLNLYLDIEKLRMGSDFFYELNISGDIETDAVKIPSMMLQPLIENAVTHGLLHKRGIRKLSIDITLADNALLKVSVKDNGIGRVKAAMIKEQQQQLLPHESKAISILQQRLQTLGRGKLVFNDLIESNGQSEGTEAVICIPVQ